jgi:MYXO-CTERM domain-containing protein
MKTRRTTCAIAALIAGTAFGSVASAEVIYAQSFESRTLAVHPEWSSNQVYSIQTNFSRFLGRYNNESVRLTVGLPADYVAQQAALGPRDSSVPVDPDLDPDANPDPNTDPDTQPDPDPVPQTRLQLLLEFDLYIIDSWDGAEQTYGVDRFGVYANDGSIFSSTFANVHHLQEYTGTPTVDRVQLGYNSAYADSIYRMSLPFDIVGSDVARLDFAGSGLLGAMNDESWGIDNVSVSVQTITVPAPGALAALAGLGAIAGTRRRRR